MKARRRLNRSKHSNRTTWKKGQSGNPKGGVIYGQTFEVLYRKHLDRDISEYVDKELPKQGITLKEAMVINDLMAALGGSNYAIERVMDRTEGKAIQRIVNEDQTLDKIKRESGGDPMKAKQMLQQEFERRGLFDTQITFAEDVEGLDYNEDSDNEKETDDPTTDQE